MSEFFSNLEEVAYSVVEYIPVLGTLYSLRRAATAYRPEDQTRRWQSVGNYIESSVRDVLLICKIGEPVLVALIHTMAESFTDKMIELYHHKPTEDKPIPTFEISEELHRKLRKENGHVLIVHSRQADIKALERKVFQGEGNQGKAKGVHHFHGAVFTGTLTDPRYAPAPGVEIWLDIPQGLYEGASVTFSWKWTVDAYGTKNSPSATWGRIKLNAGTPTDFQLSSRKGASGWLGYDFWGTIDSKDEINATTKIGGENRNIVFKRLDGT
ncbi:Uncharacterized protein Rs2_03777 [Raphanus sativus]|uniref:Iso-A82775C biosynthesis cluster protein B-like n=1 Tax=Raphanus sativus TaxID=3726 RepID=A0A9W3CS46_RAPSA|nr:iso-A82775C biosynthesis cluster protein B-like [Raphanus sativus]KAJ4909156.1 Uncharacterized protein Rs2_03777 [Raphanus sativus]